MEQKNSEVKKKKRRIFSQRETFQKAQAQQVNESALELSELKEKMLMNLEKRLGIVTYAANNTGIDRYTHYKWMERDAEYKRKVDALNDTLLDYAESRLFAAIKDRDWKALFFLLQTKGRVRGYGRFKSDSTSADPETRLYMKSNDPDIEEIIRLI